MMLSKLLSNLISAIINKNERAVRNILSQNININAKLDNCNVSALHFAAQSGNREIFTLILAAGADPFIEDIDGNTPLDICLLHNHRHLVPFITHSISNAKRYMLS